MSQSTSRYVTAMSSTGHLNPLANRHLSRRPVQTGQSFCVHTQNHINLRWFSTSFKDWTLRLSILCVLSELTIKFSNSMLRKSSHLFCSQRPYSGAADQHQLHSCYFYSAFDRQADVAPKMSRISGYQSSLFYATGQKVNLSTSPRCIPAETRLDLELIQCCNRILHFKGQTFLKQIEKNVKPTLVFTQ